MSSNGLVMLTVKDDYLMLENKCVSYMVLDTGPHFDIFTLNNTGYSLSSATEGNKACCRIKYYLTGGFNGVRNPKLYNSVQFTWGGRGREGGHSTSSDLNCVLKGTSFSVCTK